MKRTFVTVFTFLIPFLTIGQDAVWNHKRATETDSLYRLALEKFIVAMDVSSNTAAEEKEAETLFIQYENYLSMIPPSVDGYKIQFVAVGNQKEVFKENGNHLRLIKISPLALKDGQFRITLNTYMADLPGGGYPDLALSDKTIVVFDFKEGHLIYSETQKG